MLSAFGDGRGLECGGRRSESWVCGRRVGHLFTVGWAQNPRGRTCVVDERVPNDSARIVLARVELVPLDVVEFWADFVSDAIFGVVCDLANRPYKISKSARRRREPFWADEEGGDDGEDDELVWSESEHQMVILSSAWVSAVSARAARRSWRIEKAHAAK